MNANFEGAPVLKWVFRGPYTDYTPGWFENVGNVITNAVMLKFAWHIFEYFYFLQKRLRNRADDKGWKTYCCCRRTMETKKVTIQSYVDTHSGPQFPIHFKYSLV